MKRSWNRLLAATLLGGWILAAAQPSAAQMDEAFGKDRRYQLAAVEDVRKQVEDWLEASVTDESQREKILAQWNDVPDEIAGPDLIERLCRSFGTIDPRIAELVELCSQQRESFTLPDTAWLQGEELPSLVRDHVRLHYGRWLCQERLYDNAAEMLEGIKPGEVVDPATLLFYQGVAYHRLLNKERGLQAIGQLLDETTGSPKRYVSLAGLMQDDLRALKEDSLDHISRRMEDVERRLDLAQAGKKVRDIEDSIVESLDKMIEEIEKQQQQQQQQQSSGGGTQPSSQPAPDSRILGGQGPGQVDPKDVAQGGAWGQLPPKKRQEALQQIGKEFPSHYREVVEQYFRKLAAESDTPR